MKTYKTYYRMDTQKLTLQAAKAWEWHKQGIDIRVTTKAWENDSTIRRVIVHGAAQAERDAEKENRATCKHIAQEVEAYANGEYARCPECGEETRLPHSVGDKYKCPHCGEVVEYNDLEILGIWDYMADILDIDYVVSRDREYRSCKILVVWGGPNIYIDTASAMVKLYWWTEYAEYPLSYEARDAIDEWAEEYWNI